MNFLKNSNYGYFDMPLIKLIKILNCMISTPHYISTQSLVFHPSVPNLFIQLLQLQLS